jgi:hypothetical protein
MRPCGSDCGPRRPSGGGSATGVCTGCWSARG